MEGTLSNVSERCLLLSGGRRRFFQPGMATTNRQCFLQPQMATHASALLNTIIQRGRTLRGYLRRTAQNLTSETTAPHTAAVHVARYCAIVKGRAGGLCGKEVDQGARVLLQMSSNGIIHHSHLQAHDPDLPPRVSQALLQSSSERSNYCPSLRGAKTPATLTCNVTGRYIHVPFPMACHFVSSDM